MSLFQAAQSGDAFGVDFLLSVKQDVNQRNSKRATPLHAAALKGHMEIVKSLIRAKAQIDVKHDELLTPLHLAIKNGHEDIVHYLVQSGADVNIQGPGEIQPLHLAIIQKNERVVDILLKGRADPNATFSRGSVALLAKKYGTIEIREIINYHKQAYHRKKKGISYLDLEVADDCDTEWLINKAKTFDGSLQEARKLRSALMARLEVRDDRFPETRKMFWKMYKLSATFSFEAPEDDEDSSESVDDITDSVQPYGGWNQQNEQASQSPFLKAVLRGSSNSPRPLSTSPKISPFPSPKSRANTSTPEVSPSIVPLNIKRVPNSIRPSLPPTSPNRSAMSSSTSPHPNSPNWCPSSPPGPATPLVQLPEPPSPELVYCKVCKKNIRSCFFEHIKGNRHQTLLAFEKFIRKQGCGSLLLKKKDTPLHEQKIPVEVYCEQTKCWEPGVIADVVSGQRLLVKFQTSYRNYTLRVKPADNPKWLRIKKDKMRIPQRMLKPKKPKVFRIRRPIIERSINEIHI